MDLMTMFQTKRIEPQKNNILSTLSEYKRMEFEERAAIMEYDGGLSKTEAERRALEIILERREYYEKT